MQDLEYVADLTEVTRKGGALDELFRIKEEGLATAVGLAGGRIDVLMPMLRDRDFDVLLSHNRNTVVNKNAAPMHAVEKLCARYDVPTGAVALQFSMRDPDVTSTVCGVTWPQRIRQKLEWADWPISEEVWTELGKLKRSDEDPEATSG